MGMADQGENLQKTLGRREFFNLARLFGLAVVFSSCRTLKPNEVGNLEYRYYPVEDGTKLMLDVPGGESKLVEFKLGWGGIQAPMIRTEKGKKDSFVVVPFGNSTERVVTEFVEPVIKERTVRKGLTEREKAIFYRADQGGDMMQVKLVEGMKRATIRAIVLPDTQLKDTNFPTESRAGFDPEGPRGSQNDYVEGFAAGYLLVNSNDNWKTAYLDGWVRNPNAFEEA